MKKIIILFIIMSLLSGCMSKVIDLSNIEEKGDIYYEKGQEKPFTGRVTKHKGEVLVVEFDLKKGQFDGEYNLYSEEGKLLLKKIFDSGRLIKEERYATNIEILQSRFNNFLDSVK